MRLIASIVIIVISFSVYATNDGCIHKGKLYKNKDIVKFNNIRNECAIVNESAKKKEYVWINADKNRAMELLEAYSSGNKW